MLNLVAAISKKSVHIMLFYKNLRDTYYLQELNINFFIQLCVSPYSEWYDQIQNISMIQTN